MSIAKLIVVFAYCLAVLYGFSYYIFILGHTAWWFILMLMVLPNSSGIYKLTSKNW